MAPEDAVTSAKIAHGSSLALTQELPLEIENADAFAANILTGYVAFTLGMTPTKTSWLPFQR